MNTCEAYDMSVNIFMVQGRVGDLVVGNISENDVSYATGKEMFLLHK